MRSSPAWKGGNVFSFDFYNDFGVNLIKIGKIPNIWMKKIEEIEEKDVQENQI